MKCAKLKDHAKDHGSSFAKSIVWRILGVITLATLTYLFTRSWITTTLVTLIHHTIFLFVFYAHERVWKKIKIQGRKRNIIKALFYEIVLGMGIGGTIVLLFTGSWKAFTEITVVYTVVRIVTFYFYDRIWK